MYHRLRTNQEVVAAEPEARPRGRTSSTMLTGVEPSPEDADALDTTFTLYADHTMNASTFTARIIASTLADMHSAITGAIAALKGPLHGGANEEAMKMLEEVGSPERAEAYVKRPPRAQAEDHGVRPRGLPDDGPASADPQADWRARPASATATCAGTRSPRRSRRSRSARRG